MPCTQINDPSLPSKKICCALNLNLNTPTGAGLQYEANFGAGPPPHTLHNRGDVVGPAYTHAHLPPHLLPLALPPLRHPPHRHQTLWGDFLSHHCKTTSGHSFGKTFSMKFLHRPGPWLRSPTISCILWLHPSWKLFGIGAACFLCLPLSLSDWHDGRCPHSGISYMPNPHL